MTESLHYVTSPRGNSENPPMLRAPRVECVYFGAGKYERMARVLEISARKYCPRWEIRVRNVGESPFDYKNDGVQGKDFYNNNGWKSVQWNEIVQASEEGDRLLLIDADTLIRGSLDSVWEKEFDVAITTREGNNPINSGVIFVRINERSKVFFDQVHFETVRMLEDPSYHKKWEDKFGGIHQASIGAALSLSPDIDVEKLSCGEWNNEQTSRNLMRGARIVHILPQGRRALFSGRRAEPKLEKILQDWKRLDRESSGDMRWGELLLRVPRGGVVVEVGVWRGEMAGKLLASGKLGRLHLVDPWRRGVPGTSWWNSSSRMPRLPQSRYDKSYRNVRRIVKAYRGGVIHRLESLDAARIFDDGSVDLVFLDADHSEGGLLSDIDAWESKVKEGGWIGGHDYGDPRFPGVKAAVDRRFPDAEIGNDYTWWERK